MDFSQEELPERAVPFSVAVQKRQKKKDTFDVSVNNRQKFHFAVVCYLYNKLLFSLQLVGYVKK